MRRWISMRTPKEAISAPAGRRPGSPSLAMHWRSRAGIAGRTMKTPSSTTSITNWLRPVTRQRRCTSRPRSRSNIRLSLNALPSELREALLTLTIIANPIITSLHAAVVWGLEDGQQWQVEIAHRRLEVLQQTSLLQGIDYDSAHNRAQAYSLQPVIAGFLRREAQQREAEQTLDMNVARQRYARWAAMLVAQARDPQQGVNANPELAQFVQFVLPDLAAALPALTTRIAAGPTGERPGSSPAWVTWRQPNA